MRVEYARSSRAGERGFSMLAVLLVLTIIFFILATTLQLTTSGIEDQRTLRSREMIQASIDAGLGRALSRLQTMDPEQILTMQDTFNIFEDWDNAQDFVNRFTYPPNGAHANELEVRVGAVVGQRTRPPPGEDARDAYGVVVELQISVRVTGASVAETAEERVTVGVRVPRRASHSK